MLFECPVTKLFMKNVLFQRPETKLFLKMYSLSAQKQKLDSSSDIDNNKFGDFSKSIELEKHVT